MKDFRGYDPDRPTNKEIERWIKESTGGVKLSPKEKNKILKLIRKEINEQHDTN
ncbi:MAG: hypothetical protein AABY22_15920 [Nanoarchaeota archaeon]